MRGPEDRVEARRVRLLDEFDGGDRHRKSAIRVLGGESRRAGEKTRLGPPGATDVVVALHQGVGGCGANLRQAACALHGMRVGGPAGVGGVAGDTGGGRSAECDERIVHRPLRSPTGTGTQEARPSPAACSKGSRSAVAFAVETPWVHRGRPHCGPKDSTSTRSPVWTHGVGQCQAVWGKGQDRVGRRAQDETSTRTTGASSSTTAGYTYCQRNEPRSPSPAPVHIRRTTTPTSSRRTGRWYGGWWATIGTRPGPPCPSLRRCTCCRTSTRTSTRPAGHDQAPAQEPQSECDRAAVDKGSYQGQDAPTPRAQGQRDVLTPPSWRQTLPDLPRSITCSRGDVRRCPSLPARRQTFA